MNNKEEEYRIPKSGIEIITEERLRQINEEGFTFADDKRHVIGELASAASCYAMIPEMRPAELPPSDWPWLGGWNPVKNNRIKELAKAGALIAAEIDRLNSEKIKIHEQIKEAISKLKNIGE